MNTETYTTNRPAIVIRRIVNPGQKLERKATPNWAKRMAKFDIQVTTSEAEKTEDWVWELTYGAGNEPYVFASADYLHKQLSKAGSKVVAVLNEDKLPRNISPEGQQRLAVLIQQAKMFASSHQAETQALAMKKEAEEIINEARLREPKKSTGNTRAQA